MDEQVVDVPVQDRDAVRPPVPRQPSSPHPEDQTVSVAAIAPVPGDRKWRFDDAVAAARQLSVGTGRR